MVLSEFIAWRYRSEGFRKRYLKRGRCPWSGVCSQPHGKKSISRKKNGGPEEWGGLSLRVLISRS